MTVYSSKAVSYTHLDVYKRQLHECELGFLPLRGDLLDLFVDLGVLIDELRGGCRGYLLSLIHILLSFSRPPVR